MKIVITGGAGFIGSHVTELFCKSGYEVTVIDDLSFGDKKFVDTRATFIQASIADEYLMKRVLHGVDAVIHLAGLSIIKNSYDNPLRYFETNVIYGMKLLEAMKSAGVKKIINSSTAAVYGEPKRIPIREEDPKAPINAYGASKLAFEQVLKVYYHAYGIESVSLRYFNGYGPRDEQQPLTRAVPMWMKAGITNAQVEKYWEGRQIRDYIYVADIAQAHLAVLSLRGLHYYNIGSGQRIIMQEIFEKIEQLLGRKIKKIDKGERKGDPRALVADITKIQNELKWKPEVGLDEGLRKTYRYYTERFK